MTIKVQTSGKLYIAGEYAVLTPRQTALLKNIPIHMTAEIVTAGTISLSSDMFDYVADMTPDHNYALIQETVTSLAAYLGVTIAELRPFSLTITGKMERDGKKFGIGSSGSVTVLTLKALSAFYALDLSADTLFKLASYTLIKRGDNGSMGDIACIAYDEFVAFTSFDRQQVRDWIANEEIQTVLAKDWGYQIEVVKPAIACDFLVGWTKQPSISKDMIDRVKSSITVDFLKNTQASVLSLKLALEAGDKISIKEHIERISDLLLKLNPAIYNQTLLNLKSASQGLDIVAKSSGSGGGDCGIALSFDAKDSQKLIEAWENAGIELLHKEIL